MASFLQSFYILIIPSALVFFLGDAVGSRRHAWTVWAVMLTLFIGGVLWIYFSELHGTHLLQQIAGGAVPNMEGKEVRFGVFGTSLFATATTDASCGAVNAMHDSLTPLGGMLVLFNMLLGEIIYGGVGSGLYGMILFILLTVFIAGLMVGRTPDYLGKRIEGREITWCMVALLACATPILCFSAVAAVSSWGTGALNNAGAHGLSEILYAFTSGAQNNGSAFCGAFRKRAGMERFAGSRHVHWALRRDAVHARGGGLPCRAQEASDFGFFLPRGRAYLRPLAARHHLHRGRADLSARPVPRTHRGTVPDDAGNDVLRAAKGTSTDLFNPSLLG